MQKTSSASFRSCLVLSCGLATLFQSTSGQEATQLPTTLRVSTHLVLLDVVVTDKQGRPVRDLRREDFTVKEDTKAQRIAFLTPPHVGPRDLATPVLPAGVYSNRANHRIPGGEATVILLDAANTPYQDQLFARQEMLRFVQEHYKPGQSIAVFTLTDKLALVQDFTGDGRGLLDILEKFKPHEEFPLTATNSNPPTPEGTGHSAAAVMASVNAIESFQQAQLQYAIDRRVEVTLDAMRSMTRILGGIPGRKNVIWLSAGYPFNLIPEMGSMGSGANDLSIAEHGGGAGGSAANLSAGQKLLYGDKIREAAAEMSTSQIAIYPVDVNGLRASGRSDIANQESMRQMALETGGRAFVNGNDIAAGMARAMEDHASSFALGYYPDNKKWDRTYRSIDVKINRPGIELNYRHGYYAIDTTQSKQAKGDGDLAEAWRNRIPNTLIGFDAKVTTLDKGKTRVEFLVDPKSISVSDEGNGKRIDVGFYLSAVSPEGKIMLNQASKLDRILPLDVYEQVMQQDIRLHIDADVPKNSERLQLAVRDNRTGYLGTLESPVMAAK